MAASTEPDTPDAADPGPAEEPIPDFYVDPAEEREWQARLAFHHAEQDAFLDSLLPPHHLEDRKVFEAGETGDDPARP